MPKATIAVIEGRVGGGGSELALSCDMRFAGPTAVFNQPEVALGIIPGGSGTVRLPRLIGRSRALEAILGCDDIDAATAERWGWVNRVLPTDELATFVDRLAGAHRRRSRRTPSPRRRPACVRAEAGVAEQLLAEGDAFAAHARRAVGTRARWSASSSSAARRPRASAASAPSPASCGARCHGLGDPRRRHRAVVPVLPPQHHRRGDQRGDRRHLQDAGDGCSSRGSST